MKYFYFALICCALLFSSCRSAKSIDSDSKVSSKMTVKQLIRESNLQKPTFKTLQGRLKIEYTEGDKSQDYTVNLRMEKDKVIWLSATLGLARVMLTPDSAQFYDKINNQYYSGDYKLISQFLGTELDFEQIQNMLLGEPIFALRNTEMVLSDNGESYILNPKDQNPALELFYLFNPGFFKLDSQQMAQQLQKRFLQIDYKEYQDVDKQILPLNMKIIAVEDTEEVAIALEYKSITLNEEVRFPFNIPSGFKEITIDDLPLSN